MRLFFGLTLFISTLTAVSVFASTGNSFTAHELLERLDPASRNEMLAELSQEGIELTHLDSIQINYNKDESLIEIAENITTDHPSDQNPLPPKHLFYLGVRLGILIPYGIETIYFYQPHAKPLFHGSAEIATSSMMHAFSLGGGYHLGKKSFFVGLQASQLAFYDLSSGGSYEPLYFRTIGPQTGFRGPLGRSRRIVGSVVVGAQFGGNSDFSLPPQMQLKLGIAIRIGAKR